MKSVPGYGAAGYLFTNELETKSCDIYDFHNSKYYKREMPPILAFPRTRKHKCYIVYLMFVNYLKS